MEKRKESPIFGTFIDPDDILQVDAVDQLDKQTIIVEVISLKGILTQNYKETPEANQSLKETSNDMGLKGYNKGF